MSNSKITIQVPINNEKIVEIDIVPSSSSPKASLWEISPSEATENGEATVQIMEGCFYEYVITEGYDLLDSTNKTVHPSKLRPSMGRITPNIYVGTLSIDILNLASGDTCGTFQLEVRSVKVDYRTDYRLMLEDITEKCTELLMQQNAPISQKFTIDFSNDARTLYQRFAFIKSILDTGEFNDAIYKIFSGPVTNWAEAEVEKDIRGIRRIHSKTLRQIVSRSNGLNLSEQHYLNGDLNAISGKVKINYKKETVDTPENRFIKYALTYFLHFCGDFINRLKDNSKHKKEALQLEDKLHHFLSHSIFKEVSSLSTLPLNSPILQRKEGYREVLRTWLMFDLAAKLVWKGGDDVYEGGKKDVAVMYEYWLFFKLTDAIAEIFKLASPDINTLIEKTADGLGLKLKQGKECIALAGIFENKTRNLNIRFSYNRTFSGGKKYPSGGSWTSSLRPDYSLSVWPYGITEDEAERVELIVHIHFDAKYKMVHPLTVFQSDTDLDEEKRQQSKGTYKRADLLKMHAYRDAIRRTGGAYLLYPGTESKEIRGFHEILPGLGAFSISPSKNSSGMNELKAFLNKVVAHFLDRISQRERMALKTYEAYRYPPTNQLNELLPETYGSNRSLIPDETFVLIGYYKNEAHLQWIIKHGLYNTRASSLRISPNIAQARYLLLYTSGTAKKASKFFKLIEGGPRFFSKENLQKAFYPLPPTEQDYWVFEIEEKLEDEFENLMWDITQLANYPGGRNKIPFSVSLSEIMKVRFRT